MKIKKSKFAKLLTLALPIAAISIVTPVVLTSCGSSTSNGGSSGDNTQTYNASWDTSKSQEGLTFDTTNNSAVITLNDESKFAGTDISKSSTFDAIKKSLEPTTTGTTLYSVLSGAIKDVNNYNVSLSVDTNPIVFDYTNDSVGNYFEGQFVLTPKTGVNATTVNLKFRVNNFNDSYNGESGKTLTWNVKAIEDALKAKTENGDANSTGNNLPDVTPKDNGASVTIDLTNQKIGDKTVGLGKVMDELCNTTITGTELNKFINNDNGKDYNISGAKISTWAPTVDSKMVFTRIVIPNNDTSKQDAIMYIAYTGYSIQNDDGNAAWNRNILYPGNTSGITSNQWDGVYNEPIIDLSKVTGNIGSSSISSNSSLGDITNKDSITPVVDYMVKNYIIDSQNFNSCFTGIKDAGSDSGANTIIEGKFDENGKFQANTTSTNQESKATKNGNESDSTSNSPLKDVKAVEFKILLTPKNGTSASQTGDNGKGIWKSFYIINYSGSNTSTK